MAVNAPPQILAEAGVAAPRGYYMGSAACGIKAATAGESTLPAEGREDLTVLLSEHPCEVGGAFTTNQVKSASVLIDQRHLTLNRIRAIVISSGNANACTGSQGLRDAEQMARLTADRLGLEAEQVLVGTTGVIGRYLPMEVVNRGIATACSYLSAEGGMAAARAIMTTDTVPKTAATEVELGGVAVRVGGMAKGSGMIHPNMATMLAYVTTDAAVEPGWMSSVIGRIADRSFNQLSVDGDSSTNDTFLALANGAAGNPPVATGSVEADQLEAAITEVACSLVRQLARDGEGATKLITVRVTGAVDERQARQAARAVVSSNLVKAAIHGG
ncbi:MAG: bifunctional glutamate N-acetyltransferase/amino-acid acetyltransferase ArgJ, partial [Candidatus Dormibacteraceae bacterium]